MSSNRNRSCSHRAATNQSMHCRVSGCENHRHGMSWWCSAHKRRRLLYGHPEARRITPKEYAYEKQLVAAFLARNSGHVAVEAAIRFCDNLLRDAAYGRTGLVALSELQRLECAGVRGIDILTETAALWLYLRWNPRAIPDSPLCFGYAIGVAVLHLVPFARTHRGRDGNFRYRQVGSTERRELGELLKQMLVRVLINIVSAIEREEEQRNEILRDLRAPFNAIQTLGATTQ